MEEGGEGKMESKGEVEGKMESGGGGGGRRVGGGKRRGENGE